MAKLDSRFLKIFNNSTQSADFSCENENYYLIDTSSSSITATLPASPEEFSVIGFLDLKGTFDTNNLIIARNGNNIMGVDEDMTVNTKNISFELIFNNGDWRLR